MPRIRLERGSREVLLHQADACSEGSRSLEPRLLRETGLGQLGLTVETGDAVKESAPLHSGALRNPSNPSLNGTKH